MLLVIGYVIVMVATLGGFMIAGGNPVLLLHVSEFVVIGGIAAGILVISSSKEVLLAIVADIMSCLKGGGFGKNDFIDAMKLVYELLVIVRKSGLIELDDHISSPSTSSVFTKYPKILANKEVIDFISNTFRPVIDGRIKPEKIGELVEVELDAKEDESGQSVGILNLIGDSLPGVGIVAAVLGIINTMSAIAEGPEKVGEKVAAALTGTFLGVLGAYGFINPLAKRIQTSHRAHHMYFNVIATAIVEGNKGAAPLMAIEYARRKIDHSIQPNAMELEEMLKEAVKK